MKTGFRVTDYGPTLNLYWRDRLVTIVWERLGNGYKFRLWLKKYHTSTSFSWWRLFITIDNFKRNKNTNENQ